MPRRQVLRRLRKRSVQRGGVPQVHVPGRQVTDGLRRCETGRVAAGDVRGLPRGEGGVQRQMHRREGGRKVPQRQVPGSGGGGGARRVCAGGYGERGQGAGRGRAGALCAGQVFGERGGERVRKMRQGDVRGQAGFQVVRAPPRGLFLRHPGLFRRRGRPEFCVPGGQGDPSNDVRMPRLRMRSVHTRARAHAMRIVPEGKVHGRTREQGVCVLPGGEDDDHAWAVRVRHVGGKLTCCVVVQCFV